MEADSLDGFTCFIFLTLLACLQCSDDDSVRGDALRDVSYAPEKISDFSVSNFSTQLSDIPNAMKKLLQEVLNT